LYFLISLASSKFDRDSHSQPSPWFWQTSSDRSVIDALTCLLSFDLSHGKNSDTASNTAATIARIEAVCFFLASICDWSAYMRDPPVDEAGR
jgi:hypothetical protein